MIRTLALRLVAPMAAALWTLIAAPASAQQIDPAGSELVFVTTQMGLPVEGRFQRWAAQVALDPRAPAGGQLELQIRTDSVVFAEPELTAEARHPIWLDSARFPQAVFQSTGMRHLGDDRYLLDGRLTIKGQTHDVNVPLRLSQDGARGTAVGAFTLKRSDFRLGDDASAGASLVAPEVHVRFRLALSNLPTR